LALDDADKAFIKDLLASTVKAAVDPIAAKVDPAELGKIVGAHIDEKTKGFLTPEKLAEREAAAAKKASDDAEAAKGKEAEGKGKDAKPDPKVAALEAEIAKLRNDTAAATAAATAEHEKARATALHSAARDALAKKGIPAERLDLALDVLKARGLLTYEGDVPGWKGKNSVGLDAVLPLADAADAWVKGEGKMFLPPVDLGGTGEGAGRGGSGKGSDTVTDLSSLRLSAGDTLMSALAQLG